MKIAHTKTQRHGILEDWNRVGERERDREVLNKKKKKKEMDFLTVTLGIADK